MRIAIDIDGVLRDWTSAVELYYKDDYPKAKILPITEYAIKKFYPKKPDILEYCFKSKRTHEIYTFAKPYKGAIEMVKELKRKGHYIIIATTQPNEATMRFTYTWLLWNKVPFNELIFTPQKQNINADYLLDDKLDLCAYIYNEEYTLMPVVFDRPWNQHDSGLPRVKTYKEFVKLMEEKE